MTEFTSSDGVVLRQEGPNVRARAGRLNFLFVDTDLAFAFETYKTFSAEARAYFGSRWKSIRGANIDASSFQDLIRECTLHWMYFYIGNRLKVEISARDWEHPQTRRIVEMVVERRFRRGSDQAAGACAQLMGISVEEYLAWSAGEEWWRGIM